MVQENAKRTPLHTISSTMRTNLVCENSNINSDGADLQMPTDTQMPMYKSIRKFSKEYPTNQFADRLWVCRLKLQLQLLLTCCVCPDNLTHLCYLYVCYLLSPLLLRDRDTQIHTHCTLEPSTPPSKTTSISTARGWILATALISVKIKHEMHTHTYF